MALSRDVRRPLYEIEGLVSFYPHFRTDPPQRPSSASAMTCPAGSAAPTSASPRSRSGTAPIPTSRWSRDRAWAAATSAPACTVNEAPVRLARPDAALAGSPPGSAALEGIVPPEKTYPNDPYPAPGDRYAVLRDVLACRLDVANIIAALKDTGLRGMGGGVPHGPQMGPGRGPGSHAEVRDLQRRRVRAWHVQGPGDPRHPAAPGARGHAARHAGGRRRGGLGLHPPRVRPGRAGHPP